MIQVNITARFAREWFLSGVDPLVIVEGGQFLEGPAAVRASVGFVVVVIEQVLVVGLLKCESLVALTAGIGHFT
jgi:hypothetical protein